jgi:checkpoint serine/threonine-protein kinase
MIEAIDEYEGDDPLEPWLEYIMWVRDAFPSGGIQSELLPLLEACTRTFQTDERYRSDLRYLRVWVQYADCCTEPKDIYAFLEANSIGQDHALYYEAFATYLEIHKNYKRANEIFELGIARFVNQLIICKLISSRSLVWNEFFGGGEMKREKGDKKRRLFYQQCWGFF